MANVSPTNNSGSAKELAVIELRAKGLTQRAIAETLGITQGRVSQILSKAGIKK